MNGAPRLKLSLLLALACLARAADPANGTIDLPTTLRLAGASNVDVAIAREKVAEARAASDSARARYFPWITPSIVNTGSEWVVACEVSKQPPWSMAISTSERPLFSGRP